MIVQMTVILKLEMLQVNVSSLSQLSEVGFIFRLFFFFKELVLMTMPI